MTLRAPDSGKTKGMAFAGTIRWFEQSFGRDKLLAAVAAIDAEWRERFDERHATLGILEGSWYPEAQRNAFFTAITADAPLLRRQSMARSCSEALMKRSLRGLHRVVFQVMATPERFVQRGQRMWDVHHDAGQLRLKLLSSNSLEAATVDWPGHHQFGCMLNHYSAALILAEMGCADISDRRVCISEGGKECLGVYYWRAPR